MTDMQDKNESSVGLIEKQANELIAEEVQEQETEKEEQSSAPYSQDHVVETSNPKTRPVQLRRARSLARHSRRRRDSGGELYADASVPRVVYERRQGTTSRSRAYLKKSLCLYSDRAQVFFENNYERVNTNLIVSTLVVEAVGGEKLALQVADLLEGKFSSLENEMMRAVNELKRIAKEKGIPEESQVPAYDHKRTYEPPLHTPQSVQFMTLVSLFDRIVARVEGAWINKVVSSQTRKALISTWEKRLVRFVQELQKIRNDSMNTARSAGFGARAKAIADMVRDEQKTEMEQKDVETNSTDDTPEKTG